MQFVVHLDTMMAVWILDALKEDFDSFDVGRE